MWGLSDEQMAQVTRRLNDEQVIWLITVRDDQTPQPSPVWFLWDDNTILIYSQPNTPKVRNIMARPCVALHFNSDEEGGNVAIFTGEARIDQTTPRGDQHAAYLDKYGEGIQGLGSTPEQFAASYSTPIRVRLTKARVY